MWWGLQTADMVIAMIARRRHSFLPTERSRDQADNTALRADGLIRAPEVESSIWGEIGGNKSEICKERFARKKYIAMKPESNIHIHICGHSACLLNIVKIYYEEHHSSLGRSEKPTKIKPYLSFCCLDFPSCLLFCIIRITGKNEIKRTLNSYFLKKPIENQDF